VRYYARDLILQKNNLHIVRALKLCSTLCDFHDVHKTRGDESRDLVVLCGCTMSDAFNNAAQLSGVS